MFVQTRCLKRVFLTATGRPTRYYSSSPSGTSNAPSSLISYNAQLFSHLSHKQLEKAEKLIEEMQQNGVEPDVVSWKTLLLMYRTCEKTAEAAKVEDLLKSKGMDTVTLWKLTEYLQELQGQRPEDSQSDTAVDTSELELEEEQDRPNLLTLNTLIGLYAEMDQTAAVESALASLRNYSYTPNLDTYHPLVLMYCRQKEDKRVREILEEMEARNLQPNAKMYNAMMLMYGKMGLYAQLNKVATQFSGMRGRVVKGAEIDLLKGGSGGSGAGGASRPGGDKSEDSASDNKKKDTTQEVAAYATIVELYVKLYKPEAAEAVIHHLAEAGILDTIHVASYNSLISLYSRLGDTEKADELLRHMAQNDIIPNLVTEILKQNFGKLQDYSNEIQLDEKEGCYNLLAVTYAKLGQLEKVLDVVREMSKGGILVHEKTSQTIKAMVRDRGASDENDKEDIEEEEELEEENKEEEKERVEESNTKVSE